MYSFVSVHLNTCLAKPLTSKGPFDKSYPILSLHFHNLLRFLKLLQHFYQSSKSMAETCCLTSASIATTKAHSSSTLSRYPCLTKPIKLSFFTPFPSRISLKTSKFSPFNITPLVAQTSDWGQQVEAAAETEAEAETTEEVVGEEGFGDGGEESYPEPSEDAKLFVGNLPFDADSVTLAQLFNQAGVVEVAEVVYNRETDRSRGFGFVTMSTVEEAEQAIEKFNQYDLSGRLLTVNKAAPRGSRPERPQVSEQSLRIYVGNLPWEVDDARLEQVFSEHGKVVNARVVIDRETGRSRGFGFVTMASETELNDAIAALDGQSLEGRAIRVNVAEDRRRRSF